MSKVKILSILESKKDNKIIKNTIDGIIKDNKINYIDDNIVVNIYINNDNIIMKRTIKNESEINFNFIKGKKTECIYNIFNKEIRLNVFTNKLIKEEKYLEIDYKVEDEELNFKLFIG